MEDEDEDEGLDPRFVVLLRCSDDTVALCSAPEFSKVQMLP